VPPYRQTEFKIIMPRDKAFWWFQNAGGKILFTIALPDLRSFINHTYKLLALAQMTSLNIKARIGGIAGDDLNSWLTEMKDKGYIDPFSGDAYIFDKTERVIRSAGDKSTKANERKFTVPFHK
jgi:hypothetical protein